MLDNLRPLYAKQFRCIGAACEDVCCWGWEVTIDRATYQKYESMPAMQPRLREWFTVLSESEGRFARINLDATVSCPFLSRDSLCSIHRDYGESYLSETCANYPRISRRIDGLIEKPLVLSCPEAARLVLLAPELLSGYRKQDGERGYDRLLAIPNSSARRDFGAMRYVWEIRELSLRLLLDPAYDLWERLFILGMFCKKLSGLIKDGCFDQIPLLLHDYAQIAVEGKLRDAMESVPVRWEAQVAMLLETVNSFFATRGPKHYRLNECLRDFMDGLHHSEAPGIESCSRHYADGYAQYYKPFMQRHPYLLENYLVNHVFRARFPFAKGDSVSSNALNEYVFMCLEFSAIKGLLIGSAAHHRDSFSLEHVVKTVQSVVKALEHNGLVSRAINWKGLSEPISMAALLKN